MPVTFNAAPLTKDKARLLAVADFTLLAWVLPVEKGFSAPNPVPPSSILLVLITSGLESGSEAIVFVC